MSAMQVPAGTVLFRPDAECTGFVVVHRGSVKVSLTAENGREIVLYIPVVHGVEMVRDGYFGTKVEAIYDPGYLITCSLVLTVVALIATGWV